MRAGFTGGEAGPRSSVLAAPSDPVGLSWLITVRWASTAAMLAAIFVGRSAMGVAPSAGVASVFIALAIGSNVWLIWRRRAGGTLGAWPGVLVCADVLILAWLLMHAGGLLNPVSIFFLVYIVLAALVLGPAWTWSITGLAVAGYGVLFLVRQPEVEAAGAMHPEIGRHIDGMWWAFAATALLVAVLVARLAANVIRRDEALAALHERAEQSARLAGLATLAAGAAHELSTPLGTIAVSARELERALGTAGGPVLDDLALIKAETRRCRAIIDNMATRAGQPAGEMPESTTIGRVLAGVIERLPAADRSRVRQSGDQAVAVTWPVEAMTRAIANLVRNGLQAAPAPGMVDCGVELESSTIVITIRDAGAGMDGDEVRRAGEPFFTTKATGEGLGLGVFVARATVEHLGGTIDFASAAGEGTRVRLGVPRHVGAGASA